MARRHCSPDIPGSRSVSSPCGSVTGLYRPLQDIKTSKEVETPRECRLCKSSFETSIEKRTLPTSSSLLVLLLVLVGLFGAQASPGLLPTHRHDLPGENRVLENLNPESFRNRTRDNGTLVVAVLAQNVSNISSSFSKSNISTTYHDLRTSGDVPDSTDTPPSNDTRSLSVSLGSKSTINISSTTYDIKADANATDVPNIPYDHSSDLSLAYDGLANSTVVGDDLADSTAGVDFNEVTDQDTQDLPEPSGVHEKPTVEGKQNKTKSQEFPDTVITGETSYSETTSSLPNRSAKSDESILLNVNSSYTPLNSSLPSKHEISNSTNTEPVPFIQTSASPVARKPKMLIKQESTVGDFNVAPGTDLAEKSEFPSMHFEADDSLAEETEFHSTHFEAEGALIDAFPKSNSGKDISSSHIAKDPVGSDQDKDEPKQDSENEYFVDAEFQDAQKRKHIKKPIITLAKAGREENVIPVRKCCDKHEFFSSISRECLPTTVSHFSKYAASLSSIPLVQNGSEEMSVDMRTGKILACPDTGAPPDVSAVSSDSYRILPSGTLINVQSGFHYDHENYCLEVFTQDASVHDPSSLILIICPRVTVRKCCREDEYFDFGIHQCLLRPPDMTNVTALLTELASEDLNLEMISLKTSTLTCQISGKPETLENSFLNARGELCIPDGSFCYQTKDYCIEHVLLVNGSVQTMTVACPQLSFHKCCALDEMLSEEGCIPRQGHRSAYLTQFVQTRRAHEKFFPNYWGPCSRTVLGQHEEFRWWVDEKGYLLLQKGESQLEVYHYCIDDLYSSEGDIQPKAVTCAQEIDSIVSSPEAVGVDGILGKCCPRGQAISEDSYECIPDQSDFNPLEYVHLFDKNISGLVYASYPPCPLENKGYHLHYFAPATKDHVKMMDDLSLRLVSIDASIEGTYVEQTNEIGMTEYCVDTVLNDTGAHPAKAAVIVCSVEWLNRDPHIEKFIVLPLLLGISCVFLLATAVVLSCMRVRRGLVTVKKVNTLAGRILLSYVVSYLLGSLALISNMVYVFESNYAACSTLAGMTLFFMLAGFHWNTSICFESLLLTVHVGTSEGWRFVLHSLLAWGLPGIITIVALTLDAHRNQLPRHIVTLHIGRLNCLTGDHLAMVLYMYIPISITLAANLGFLVGAKVIRSYKLKRLERGGGRRKPRGGEAAAGPRNLQGQNGAIEMQQKTGQQRPAQKQHSGMRTHQNRNLTVESVKLALWSGVTWVIDILGWVITRYVYTPNQQWYDYLWYIPAAINSLRGIGIFIILVLTPENRIKLMQMFSSLTKSSQHHTRNSEAHSSSVVNSQYPQQFSSSNSGALNRNPSTSTTLTHLSTFRSNASGPPLGMSGRSQGNNNGIANGSGAPRHTFVHSVSQIDMRRDSTVSMRLASQSSEVLDDVFEDPSTTPSGGDGDEAQYPKVRSGLDLGKRLKSLQSVDEEDVFELPSSDKASFTGSTETIDTTTC